MKEYKLCPQCKETKHSSLFGTRKSKDRKGIPKLYLTSYCNNCANIKSKKDQKNNPHIRMIRKKSDMQKKFGITLEQYNEMRDKQNNKCYICGQYETSTNWNKIRDLAVDHNHTTGQVRKLLCSKCNFGIGLFNEDEELLGKVIAYLKEHRGVKNG